MTTANVTFQEVVELASHLSFEERSRLVAWIEAGLDAAHAGCASGDAPPGSAAAILRAMHEPPHPSSEDVDALEQAIDNGKLPVRHEGVSDGEDSE
jgi:hypothetical protein